MKFPIPLVAIGTWMLLATVVQTLNYTKIISGAKLLRNVIGDENLMKIRHRIHERLHRFIVAEIESIHSNPNATILGHIYPEAAGLLSTKVKRLEECYDSGLGGEKVDLFKAPLREVIHKYLARGDGLDRAAIRGRIKTLLKNLLTMAKSIISCVKGKNQPTRVGLTKFTDMEPEQLYSYGHGLGKRPQKLASSPSRPLASSSEESNDSNDSDDEEYDIAHPKKCHVKGFTRKIPEEFDYRQFQQKRNVVSPVLDQNGCGLCYLMASISAIESAYMIKYNKSGVVFSITDPYNCIKKALPDINPCNGSRLESVFRESEAFGNFYANQADPFPKPRKTEFFLKPQPEKCARIPKDQAATSVLAFCQSVIPKRDDTRVKKILLKYGPVTVNFRAPAGEGPDKEPELMNAYYNNRGPMNVPCNTTNPTDHSMLLVGWTKEHWIIKNSYGTTNRMDPHGHQWGRMGYLYMNKKIAESCGMFGTNTEDGTGFNSGVFMFPIVK